MTHVAAAGEFYAWLKAIHVVVAIVFVSGTLLVAVVLRAIAFDAEAARKVLPRVRRWDRRVTVPAMLLTWIFGLTLGLIGDWFRSPWLVAKLVFVVALSGLHGVLSARLRSAANGTPPPPLAWSPSFVIACVTVIVVFAVTKV